MVHQVVYGWEILGAIIVQYRLKSPITPSPCMRNIDQREIRVERSGTCEYLPVRVGNCINFISIFIYLDSLEY